MVHNYMSILSVYEYHIPDLIIFHTNCEPNGTYWEALKTTIDSRMKIVKRSPPTSIWGHTVKKVEHQSDVARLEILLEVGGIYMDDDVVVLKSLDSLRMEEMVLGEENYDALANSVIMADPGSWFLRKWFSYYRDFNDTKWSESSCFVPWSLWNLFPSALRVVKEKMLRPNWEEIKFLYHELWDWRENFSVHLYSRFMLAVDGTPERSLQELSVLNTTYGEIARYVIWQSSQIRDITEWMV
uniref:Alpha-1,4-N-acetylglucosaminyltransferase n=1 Tax=Ciona savignyi TaxID=51511 RepID=H2Y704_CIOSA